MWLKPPPHEVAHYVVDCLCQQRVRPHGSEWQAVMMVFGVEPRVTGQFDLTGVPQRQQRTVSYQCGCSHHQLGIRRHNKVQRNQAEYRCKRCGEVLTPVA